MSDLDRKRTDHYVALVSLGSQFRGFVGGVLEANVAGQWSAERAIEVIREQHAAYSVANKAAWDAITAEVEALAAEQAEPDPCPYTQAHTRTFCGRATCREA